eukprot:TRINITY_DN3571_c1_g1_i1.p1 TRINITY_DN3571_c1_g1~~TRINITY_DN3571_c1_g1_i1.p1  ORF type:complete len:195 (-),score=34.42 TRINITY_DN3571_c1_g1_i1:647-1231(-)
MQPRSVAAACVYQMPPKCAPVSVAVLAPLFHAYGALGERVLPDWLAPNVVTVAGTVQFLASLCAFYLMLWVYGSVQWGCLLLVVCVCVYQVLDTCDGAHARRIHCTSAVGDFLDTCSDCLFVMLIAYPLHTVLHVPLDTAFAPLLAWLPCADVIASVWATLHTHTDEGPPLLPAIPDDSPKVWTASLVCSSCVF